MKFPNASFWALLGTTTSIFLGVSTLAVAADTKPLTYSDVTKILGQGAGNVKKTKALLIGRNISIKVQVGADTVTVNDEDRVFFSCKNLKSFKAGETVFAKVVDYSETGGDSDPLILLDSCNLAKAQSGALSPPGTSSGQVLYSTGGSSEPREQFIKLESVEFAGKIVRDRNGGGWFYALVVPGRKPIRIENETEKNYKSFEKIVDTDLVFLVKGDIGTFSGGSKAFDTTKPLSIRRSL